MNVIDNNYVSFNCSSLSQNNRDFCAVHEQDVLVFSMQGRGNIQGLGETRSQENFWINKGT